MEKTAAARRRHVCWAGGADGLQVLGATPSGSPCELRQRAAGGASCRAVALPYLLHWAHRSGRRWKTSGCASLGGVRLSPRLDQEFRWDSRYYSTCSHRYWTNNSRCAGGRKWCFCLPEFSKAYIVRCLVNCESKAHEGVGGRDVVCARKKRRSGGGVGAARRAVKSSGPSTPKALSSLSTPALEAPPPPVNWPDPLLPSLSPSPL